MSGMIRVPTAGVWIGFPVGRIKLIQTGDIWVGDMFAGVVAPPVMQSIS
jgi:hypothetical protein